MFPVLWFFSERHNSVFLFLGDSSNRRCSAIPLCRQTQLSLLGGSLLDQETVYLTLLEAAVRAGTSSLHAAPPEYTFSSFTQRDAFDADPNGSSEGSADDVFQGASDGSGSSNGCGRNGRRGGGVTGLLLARALLAERTALKTGSAQSWVRYAVVLERLGDETGADAARLTAHALGLGQGGKGAH
jgi:hypothetical protein